MGVIPGVDGYMYPNEMELQWSVLIVLYPFITGLVAGAFILQFMVQGAWGVVPAHINELSPDSVRGFLPGFAYQCGVLIAGSVAYIEAVFAVRFSYASAMALTALTVFTLACVVIGLGRERHGVEFGGPQAS